MAIKSLAHAKAVQGRREAQRLPGMASAVRRWCRANKKNYGEVSPNHKTEWRAA